MRALELVEVGPKPGKRLPVAVATYCPSRTVLAVSACRASRLGLQDRRPGDVPEAVLGAAAAGLSGVAQQVQSR